MGNTDSSVAALDPAELRTRIDPDSLGFETTAEVETFDAFLGQDRATAAIDLAAGMQHHGFNLFVLGELGTGRHFAVHKQLSKHAEGRPVPDDWVYVNNFEDPQAPRCLRLPPGTAIHLAEAMAEFVNDLATEIPASFEADEYQSRRRAIEADYSDRQDAAMAAFAERAHEENIALVRTPMGYMLAAARDGKVLNPDEFEALEKTEQQSINEKIGRLQEDLAQVLRNAPKLDRESRREIEKLNAETAEHVVSARMEELQEGLPKRAGLAEYLVDVQKDVIANAELFLEAATEQDNGPFPQAVRKYHEDSAFDRYAINVMVSSEGTGGAPVIREDQPTLDQLTGRVEHIAELGALLTNFTMIRPGALHRANGGYLVMDAQQVLSDPFAWEALKRCLKSREISISSLAERLSLASTTSLEPDPIPLDVRVVLVGDRMLHALLTYLDPEFPELFKLQADFETSMSRTSESTALYGRLIGTLARREGLCALSAGAVTSLLEEALRLSADRRKFSLRIGALTDILHEGAHYAGLAGHDRIESADVTRAIVERDRRASRIRDRFQEAVERRTILIDTDGSRTGQVNGLSVIGLGDYSFGYPSRITARVRLGGGKLIDIEREVELGGPLHSKGVMILAGYLSGTFALDLPFSLHASLVFEQSYGGIEGDSASSAELYALLSALADLPIDQGLAVTGSVNQFGEIQAIGGVNEKIEGFFETCRRRGLTGRQGVLIPASNVDNLMLREEVADAARNGVFRVIPVQRIDEGIALLTGREAGVRGAGGAFPETSVNGLVEATLRAFATQRRAFGQRNAGDGSGPPA
ncbi:AAA family ATPase [Mameliella sp. AT18]|uniref:Lon protease family protein n=1 Tax=Mameliella sp. AT18 TaxID=3028385 RepID=UPI00237A1BE6|nr:AAA family ATPase [Mameliella sp. AT18]MDD9731296.1 AAA family ATPase [Mameliella sp. AT18]